MGKISLDGKAFRDGVGAALTMRQLRWWLFKVLSRIGWAVCPEPYRSDLRHRLSFDGTPLSKTDMND